MIKTKWRGVVECDRGGIVQHNGVNLRLGENMILGGVTANRSVWFDSKQDAMKWVSEVVDANLAADRRVGRCRVEVWREDAARKMTHQKEEVKETKQEFRERIVRHLEELKQSQVRSEETQVCRVCSQLRDHRNHILASGHTGNCRCPGHVFEEKGHEHS